MPREGMPPAEGLENLKEELEELSTTRRREVADRIKEAREFGDIAENSEYDDAKNEQALLETLVSRRSRRRSAPPKVVSADDPSAPTP